MDSPQTPSDAPRAFLREIAAAFHDEYEARARTHGWETNPTTRVDFDDLPIENRTLMCAVISALIRRGIISIGAVSEARTTQLETENARMSEALELINQLRSNVTATQSASWSNTQYPLVAILNAAGYVDHHEDVTEAEKAEHLHCYGGAGGVPTRRELGGE